MRRVTIGEQAFVGAGTTIKQNTYVARLATVGLGSAVVYDLIQEDKTYFGAPASQTRFSQRQNLIYFSTGEHQSMSPATSVAKLISYGQKNIEVSGGIYQKTKLATIQFTQIKYKFT